MVANDSSALKERASAAISSMLRLERSIGYPVLRNGARIDIGPVADRCMWTQTPAKNTSHISVAKPPHSNSFERTAEDVGGCSQTPSCAVAQLNS